MRKILLTTAAAVAIATPALAENGLYGGYEPGGMNSGLYSNVVGGLEIGYYGIWPDGGDSLGAFRGKASANIPVGNNWNILVETGGGAIFEDGDSKSAIGANGHLWRNNGNVRWGVFGGAHYSYGYNFGKVGAEIDFDVTSRITLGAQISYDFSDDVDIFAITGSTDYYFTPNTVLSGSLTYFDTDYDDGWAYNKRLTHRFSGSPLNIFGEVDYVNFDGDHVWSAGAGLSVIIDGNGTQESYNKNGVPFEAFNLNFFY